MIPTGNIRKPEFIEDDFISGLETAVSKSWHPPWPLEISRVSQDAEHTLGYDGVLTSLVPFYIQFKASYFCLPQFTGATTGQRNDLGLPTNRGYFRFKLHKDKKTKRFDQHNALFKLGRSQRVAYVAPMFYKKQQLTAFKQMSMRLPWAYDDYMIFDHPRRRNFSIRSSRAFARCITIQPHREIEDKEASHYYSFSDDANAGFHSKPENVGRGVQSLSQFLTYIAEAVFENRDRNIPIRDSLLKNLADVYDSTWENRAFLATIRSALLDLDLYPQKRKPNVREWVFDTLELHHVLLLTESLLQDDFNIVQYLAKPMY